jgi:DNA-3-methyladenine glycosylase II
MKKKRLIDAEIEPPPYARAALQHLRRVDPVLARIIGQVGPFRAAHRPERFQALVRAIIFQQLAGRAAQAIYNRFVKATGGSRFPTPRQVLAATDDDLRGAGLSRGKMAYIRDLAAKVAGGEINFRRFAKIDDEEIIEQLTRVKGIGRWTAEMFLMFNLRRPDVLPVDDLGFRNAVAKAYEMRKPLTPKELRVFGERWRPYRTVAVWYFWQSTRIVTPGDPGRAVAPAAVRRKMAPAGSKPARVRAVRNSRA